MIEFVQNADPSMMNFRFLLGNSTKMSAKASQVRRRQKVLDKEAKNLYDKLLGLISLIWWLEFIGLTLGEVGLSWAEVELELCELSHVTLLFMTQGWLMTGQLGLDRVGQSP